MGISTNSLVVFCTCQFSSLLRNAPILHAPGSGVFAEMGHRKLGFAATLESTLARVSNEVQPQSSLQVRPSLLNDLKLKLRSLPAFGPAVGPGPNTDGLDLVQNLTPVPSLPELDMFCCGLESASTYPWKVPAEVRLLASNPLGGAELVRYKSVHAKSLVYRAAARLWACGLDWESAYTVANDAYQTAQSICG